VDGLLRKLLAPMLLLMWAGLYWLWSSELLETRLAIGLIGSHLICTMIFHNFVYVFNYGYALIMIIIPIYYGATSVPSLSALIVLAIVVAYGVRLMNFSWRRYHSESYTERKQGAEKLARTIPIPVKIITWFFISSLMFYIAFNAWIIANSDINQPTIWPAGLVMIVGLLVETIADNQKQRSKNENKDVFCYTGLYKAMRHPNYLGEIIFHIGFYWAMLSATNQFYPLILGGFGTGWIVMLMSQQAITNDRKQQERYGNTGQFIEYRKNTGLLLPKLF